VVAALGGVGERSATPVPCRCPIYWRLHGAASIWDTGEIARVGLAVVVVSVFWGQALVPRLPGKTGGGPGHLCRNQ
jgi:hypothetical protein